MPSNLKDPSSHANRSGGGQGVFEQRRGEERGDLQLITQALVNGWQIPESMHSALPMVAARMLNSEDERIRIRAIGAILAMKAQNQHAAIAQLQYHLAQQGTDQSVMQEFMEAAESGRMPQIADSKMVEQMASE